ncbi:hypothetical protein SAMN02745130_01502 [Thiothrix eikelboomii]|uniref:Oxidoreductase molybdopterin-binding domain-containing protein n=2 Tax=Thiothrix eikelboomii TaxID=92487 RepID=A0A1T4WF64_9GAMM|nr:hypothetical protein SAMN02745130_01502 [Thiothrix eikelboomii]
MQCGKPCLLIVVLMMILIGSGLYLTSKLLNPLADSPIVTHTGNSQSTPPFPPIPQPAGNLEQVLIVQTDPNSSCGTKEFVFSEQQLQALPQTSFKTKHTWANIAQEFSGPLLTDVLKQVCANARDIYLRSLDKYSVMVNFQAIAKYQPILALKVNGQALTIREKGPLWLMINTDEYKLPPRSLDNIFVWQLYYIRVLTSD